MGRKSHSVGIFSRDGTDNYQWLISLLEEPCFKSTVKSVCPIYIGNSFAKFRSDISQCTFAIIYHTQKRGRLNITDVPDSLYDEELEKLFLCLHKENIIVVVDDLEISNKDVKRDILETQPKIKEFSQALFLISKQEKRAWTDSKRDVVPGELEDALKSIQIKKDQIKKVMGKKAPPDDGGPLDDGALKEQNNCNETRQKSESCLSCFHTTSCCQFEENQFRLNHSHNSVSLVHGTVVEIQPKSVQAFPPRPHKEEQNNKITEEQPH